MCVKTQSFYLSVQQRILGLDGICIGIGGYMRRNVAHTYASSVGFCIGLFYLLLRERLNARTVLIT